LQAAFQSAVHLSAAQREQLCHVLFGLASLLPDDHSIPPGGDHLRQQAALTLIEERLGDSAFCARVLAARAGLSRRRLDEIFVKNFGRPVSAYIWERRLERARDMLHDVHHMGRTVTEIAFSVGFEDASHFSRAFRNRFGTAPSAWRSQATGIAAH
jgi:AraC-like DNA-binding protein